MKSLSKELREGTKKAHTMAENTGFITCFLKGVVEKESYMRLLCDLYHIYSIMESQFERHKDHAVVGKIYFPELFRKESLEKDLHYYLGDHWRLKLTQTKSCREYMNQIQIVSDIFPELLISHHYTRYIGDLSGGQVLKRITETALNVGDSGLNFYTFNDIPNNKEFKDNYRNTLDSLELSEKTITSIVTEANNAFKLNINLFNEIEGNLILAIGKLLFSSLTGRHRKGSTEK